MGRILLGVVFLLSCCASFVRAGDTFLMPGNSAEAAEILAKAAAFANEGNWPQAIACYQTLLEQHRQRVVAVETGRYQSCYDLAIQNFNRLTPQIKKDFPMIARLQVQKIAESLPMELARNLTVQLEGDDVKKATLYVSDYYLAQEQYQQALYHLVAYWQNYCMEKSSANKHGEILARLAFCYFALGNEAALANLIQKYSLADTEPLMLAGKSQKIGDYFASISAQMQSRADMLDQDANWPTLGKNHRRDSACQQPITTLKPSWNVRIPMPAKESQQRYFYNERQRNEEGPCPYYPVVADGTLFLNNGKDVYAYNLFLSKLKWHYQGLVTKLKSETHEQVIHSVTYHDGAVYANVEGESLTQRQEVWSIYQIRKILPERRLVKLDAATGQVLWQIKDPKGDEDSFANKVSFMTPPVVLGNTVYVGATELSGIFNSYLVAIGVDDGQIVWKTLIGSAQQELNMFGRPVREAVGSVVATGNGQLYYSTNLGACCCIEPLTGRILWLYNYDRIPVMAPERALFTTIYREAGWYNGPVVLAGDNLWVAPIDSDYLYCLDAWTGKEKWKRHRSTHRYFLGVANDRLLLGGRNLEICDANTGVSLKTLPLHLDKVAGLGVMVNNVFYCPTSNYLYGIDLQTQKIAVTIKWPVPSQHEWHLVMADAIICTASPQFLNVFYDLKEIEAHWQKQIEEKPNSPIPCLSLARIYSEKGSNWLPQAEKFYKRGYLLARNLKNMENQSLLVAKAEQGLLAVYLTLADQYKAAKQLVEAHKCYSKALGYAKRPQTVMAILFEQYQYFRQTQQYDAMKQCLDRLIVEYGTRQYYLADTGTEVVVAIYALSLLARHYEEVATPEQAVEIYQTILQRYPNHSYEGMQATNWAANHIKRLIRAFGQNIYAALDQEAWQLYQQMIAKKVASSDIMYLLEKYPNSQHLPQIALAMIRLLIQEGKTRNAAEHLRRFVRENAEHQLACDASVLLIECYEKLEMYKAAKGALLDLRRKYSAQTIRVAQQELTLSDYVTQKLRQPVYEKVVVPTIPELVLWEDQAPQFQSDVPSANFLLRLLEVSGQVDGAYEHLLFLNMGDTLYCRNGATGELTWKRGLGWIRGVGFLGKRLFAWGRGHIVCLEPDTGATLWRTEVPNRFVSVTLGESVIATISYDHGQGIASVATYDPETGTVVWSANCAGQDPGDVVIGPGILAIFIKSPSQLYFYELATGKLLRKFSKEQQDQEAENWEYYPILCGSNQVCILREMRWLECYQISSWELMWKYDAITVALPTLVANDEAIAFIARNQFLIVLDTVSGDAKWRWQIRDNCQVSKVMLDTETVYFLETKEDAQATSYLWTLDLQSGALRWAACVAEERNAHLSLLLTQKYILVLSNRSRHGWQSAITVFDKFQGKLKAYEVKGGDRGRTVTELCVRAGNLWLVKDNSVWSLRK